MDLLESIVTTRTVHVRDGEMDPAAVLVFSTDLEERKEAAKRMDMDVEFASSALEDKNDDGNLRTTFEETLKAEQTEYFFRVLPSPACGVVSHEQYVKTINHVAKHAKFPPPGASRSEAFSRETMHPRSREEILDPLAVQLFSPSSSCRTGGARDQDADSSLSSLLQGEAAASTATLLDELADAAGLSVADVVSDLSIRDASACSEDELGVSSGRRRRDLLSQIEHLLA
ncbi:unnamed protein product, partial [Amoebophrya sp. A25]|eukprot:GSA25T00021811001.1